MSAFANIYDPFKILLDEITKQKGIEFSRWDIQELLSKVTPYVSPAPSGTQRPRKLISRRGWAWPHPSKALDLFLDVLNTRHPLFPGARPLSWRAWQAWAKTPRWDALPKHETTIAAAIVYDFWLQTFQAIVDARLRGEPESAIIRLFEAWSKMAKANGFPRKLRTWIRAWQEMLQYTLGFQSEEVRIRIRRGACGHYFLDPTRTANKRFCSTRCRVAAHRAKTRPAR